MKRIVWLDNLRGMSILAVIFLHCEISLAGNVWHFSEVSSVINQLLGPVRLGLMFFISGLFVNGGLKKGTACFLQNKVRAILYPFAVWCVIYGGLKWLFSSRTNHPQPLADIIITHLSGGGDITWFLHSLFFFFLAILPLRRLPVYLVIPATLLLSYLLPVIPAGSPLAGFDNAHLNKSLYLFAFFYLGDWLVKNNVDVLPMARKPPVVWCSLLAFLLLSVLNLFSPVSLARQLLAPLALLSIPLFIVFAASSRHRLLNTIGSHSIVYYLSHYLVIQAFAKLVRVDSSSLWVNDLQFVVAFSLALALPWGICQLRNRGIGDALFTLKKKEKKRMREAT